MSKINLDELHSGGEQEMPLPEGARTDSEEINEMFEVALQDNPDNEFLWSIHAWWEEKGFLTEKQYEALAKYCNK